MAQFSDLGSVCVANGCKQQDFLPFECENCHKMFCLDHRTPKSHNCSQNGPDVNVIICETCKKSIKIRTGEDFLRVKELHALRYCTPIPVIVFCPVRGCPNKLTDSGSIVCPNCKTRVCLSHRYQDSHKCSTKQKPSFPGRAHGMVPDWTCRHCKSYNPGTAYRCRKCQNARTLLPKVSSPGEFKIKGEKSNKCVIS